MACKTILWYFVNYLNFVLKIITFVPQFNCNLQATKRRAKEIHYHICSILIATRLWIQQTTKKNVFICNWFYGRWQIYMDEKRFENVNYFCIGFIYFFFVMNFVQYICHSMECDPFFQCFFFVKLNIEFHAGENWIVFT